MNESGGWTVTELIFRGLYPFSSPRKFILMRTKMVLEKSIQLSFNHLTLLVALETFIGFSRSESFALYDTIKCLDIMSTLESLAYLCLCYLSLCKQRSKRMTKHYIFCVIYFIFLEHLHCVCVCLFIRFRNDSEKFHQRNVCLIHSRRWPSIGNNSRAQRITVFRTSGVTKLIFISWISKHFGRSERRQADCNNNYVDE